ncbi:MAG: glycoside hydrolase family 9 protein [Pseudomonadota bacterium]
MRIQSSAVLVSLILAGCGGGGTSTAPPVQDDPPATPPAPPPDPPPSPPPTGSSSGDGPFIVVDQFGYLPTMPKVAVIRDPVIGYDSADAIEPASTYELVRVSDQSVVFSAELVEWNDGNVHAASGDRAWWFDFSSITQPGSYFVRDPATDLRSAQFEVGNGVYEEILKQAVRTMFYQRAGFAKNTPFIAPGWADDASHLGPGQDTEARRFLTQNDVTTARDLRGGWYDAGDYNKYTNWTADYVISLLTTYRERPQIFGDDFGIPESGNGVPDLLDEIKYGVDHLLRMQNPDGSVLSIVGLDSGASPPSAATGPSYYGDASTSATLTSAAAFALASQVYDGIGTPALPTYADQLRSAAVSAWDWAAANPAVVFRNNDASSGTQGLGAGQQEVDENGRADKRLSAAIYLAASTGEARFHDYVEANYGASKLVGGFYVNGFENRVQRDLLFYTTLSGAPSEIRDTIRDRYGNAMQASAHWPAIDDARDAYQAPLDPYTWGSNAVQAARGLLFAQLAEYDIGARSAGENLNAAAGFIHYLHGVNPQGLVYLSNMGEFGAERSVDTFYHAWFPNGSTEFDSVKDSSFGPAPGFLVGGPNPTYDWDGCCPSSCGSADNDARCGLDRPAPPFGQPPQKAYREFNDNWPLNSWQITENSNGYQVVYIRLLSKFVGE